MTVIATVLTALVALIHVYIVVLEMFLWDTPRGRAAFGTSRELATQTKVLAANQGLYNGFLVAGLVLALVGPRGAPLRLRALHALVRGRRRRLRRCHREPSHPVGAGAPGGARARRAGARSLSGCR